MSQLHNYKLSFRNFKLQTLNSALKIKMLQTYTESSQTQKVSAYQFKRFASVLTITRIFMRQIWVLKGKNYTFMVMI